MTLRNRLLLMNTLLVGVVLLTLFLVTLALAPTLHDQLMLAMGVTTHDSAGEMTVMARATEQAFRGAMVQALAIAGIAAAIVGIGVSLLTSRRLAAPLTRLLHASARIAAGHYTERVPELGDAELHALSAQFNRMASALATVEQRRQALLTDVAHELRTPLATIQGYAEGVLDGVISADRATWTLLRDEAIRLGRLTNDLRELSRADAGQLVLRYEAMPLDTVIDRALTIVQPPFTAKHVLLERDVPRHVPPVVVDSDRIAQVLVNLLSNALHASTTGSTVKLCVSLHPEWLQITVEDDGVGIAAAHLPHVFERFYRVDPARSRTTGGSGVGLPIARALVEAHGGELTLVSAGLGCGTTARLLLPRSGHFPMPQSASIMAQHTDIPDRTSP